MPNNLDPETLSKLDHATLYRMRAAAPPELQDLLAGYEHRAFARELVGQKPWMAPSLAVATPMYQAAKLAPLLTGNKSRSSPSWTQLGQGFAGIGEGLLDSIR